MTVDNNRFSTGRMSEYEKSFRSIIAHDTIKYENPDGTGHIVSYSKLTRGMVTTYPDSIVIKQIKENELVDTPESPLARSGQHDITGTGDVKMPVIVLSKTGTFLFSYDPTARVFFACDFYHHDNDFTDWVVNLMRITEKTYETKGIWPPKLVNGELEKGYIVMNGKMYATQLLTDNIIKCDIEEKYKSVVDTLQTEIRELRGTNPIGVTKMEADNHAKLGISIYSLTDSSIVFAKTYPIAIDSVSWEHSPFVYKLKSEFVYEQEVTIMIICNGAELYPTQMKTIEINRVHPHRFSNDNNNSFSYICTGNIDMDELRNVDELAKKFDLIAKTLRTVNLSSLAYSDSLWCGKVDNRTYRKEYVRLAHNEMSVETRDRLMRRYDIVSDMLYEEVVE